MALPPIRSITLLIIILITTSTTNLSTKLMRINKFNTPMSNHHRRMTLWCLIWRGKTKMATKSFQKRLSHRWIITRWINRISGLNKKRSRCLSKTKWIFTISKIFKGKCMGCFQEVTTSENQLFLTHLILFSQLSKSKLTNCNHRRTILPNLNKFNRRKATSFHSS